jgi:hypothetical protein
LGDIFLCFPSLASVSPPAVTEHRVESPNGFFSGGESGSGSAILSSLNDLIAECTNGVWSLYINQGDPSERVFTFRVTISGLNTNWLVPVTILSPANGSMNVPTNAPFSWAGPGGFGDVFAQKYKLPYDNVVHTNLPGTATNWPAPPPLDPGTNRLYVHYRSNDFPGVTFTMPVDGDNLPLAAWSTRVAVASEALSQFVVGGPPAPVQLLHPRRSGTNFQFQFLSEAGRSNLIQSRTNLVLGVWQNRTSILGDGTLKTVVLPMSGLPAEFFRIVTQ